VRCKTEVHVTAWAVVLLTLAAGCGGGGGSAEKTLADFPIKSLDGVLTLSGVDLDKQISSDGNGSLRIVTPGPTTVRLFEIRKPDVDDARLIYRAMLRTRSVSGDVYLEMWCRFPGKGEFFSKGLDSPLRGTTDWTSQEIYFMLKKGQKPDLVRLDVVIGGSGTVWIDDLALLEAPLR
jgi:hypothetical protein